MMNINTIYDGTLEKTSSFIDHNQSFMIYQNVRTETVYNHNNYIQTTSILSPQQSKLYIRPATDGYSYNEDLPENYVNVYYNRV